MSNPRCYDCHMENRDTTAFCGWCGSDKTTAQHQQALEKTKLYENMRKEQDRRINSFIALMILIPMFVGFLIGKAVS